MKSSRIFWGVFFLALGVLLLLSRMDVLAIEWGDVWRLWPLLLIMWGVSVLLRNRPQRWVIAPLAAVLLGIVVFGFFSMSWIDEDWHEHDRSVQTFSEPFDSTIATAFLHLDAAIGSYSIVGTSDDLITAEGYSTLGGFSLRHTSARGSSASLLFEFDGEGKGWMFGRVRNRAELHLNPSPIWDLDLDVGASRGEFDLTELKVRELKVDAGAAKVWLTLGSRFSTTVNIDAGAASIRIKVPRESGCEIRTDTGLTGKRFSGFDRIESDLYRTDNFSSAKEHITISVSAGAASISVERF